jgi:FkbM family methyltransferase
MDLDKTLARGAIGVIGNLSHSPISTTFPFRRACRALEQRATHWLARRAAGCGRHFVNGVWMNIPAVPDWGGGGELHLALGSHERAALRFVLGRLGPGDVFVDVGAHIGYYTLPAAKRVGGIGEVFAIEPSRASARLLQENLALNGIQWARVQRVAAGACDGSAELAVSDRSPMWNTLHSPMGGGTTERLISVPMRSLDSILSDAEWPKLAGIKLDVAGSELAVLEGARETLERNPRAFIVLEIGRGFGDTVSAACAVIEWLALRNYQFRALTRLRAARRSETHELVRLLLGQTSAGRGLNVVAERLAP